MASTTELLLGGSLTIAGGVAGTFLQGYLQGRARSDEQEERRREARREKAEQVFKELGELVSAYNRQWVNAAKQLTFQMAKKTPGIVAHEPDAAPSVPSMATLEAMVSIYFPEYREMVADFNEEIRAVTEKHTREMREYVEAHKDDGKLEPLFVAFVSMAMGQELTQRASAFAERLRAAMHLQIEKLW